MRRVRMATMVISPMRRPSVQRGHDEDERRDLHHRVAGRRRAGVQRRGAEHEADEPRRRSSRPWLTICVSRTNRTNPKADQQQARDVERQAAEADEREDERERAQDPGHEVRVLAARRSGPVDAERRTGRTRCSGRTGGGGTPGAGSSAASVDGRAVDVERDRSPCRRPPPGAVGLREDVLDASRRSRRPRPRPRASAGRVGARVLATVETAQSTGRPRASAIAGSFAIASLRTLSPIVPGMSSPLLLTGDGGADVRAGRHVREVRGERDERAGARGPGARRARPRR